MSALSLSSYFIFISKNPAGDRGRVRCPFWKDNPSPRLLGAPCGPASDTGRVHEGTSLFCICFLSGARRLGLPSYLRGLQRQLSCGPRGLCEQETQA